jgi:acetolactate synthase-1/2/3 large subunit
MRLGIVATHIAHRRTAGEGRCRLRAPLPPAPCQRGDDHDQADLQQQADKRGDACEAGASRLLVVQKWEAYGPREFLTSNGLGSMGYAVPGALGARLAFPHRPIVAFTGDGGMLMAVAELQTSMRENLPIIIVVFDDQEIGLIRVKQEIKQIPLYGVKLGGVDWEKLAQGFGVDGVVVDTEQALGDALQTAMRANKTTLIAARIDSSGYVDQFNALREL